MGKIQEEFETWLNKDITNDEYKFANTTFNEFYSFLDEDNSKEIFMKVGFQGGRKSRDEEIRELKQNLSIIENTCIGLHFPAVKGSLEMHKYIEAMNKIEKLEKILKENT